MFHHFVFSTQEIIKWEQSVFLFFTTKISAHIIEKKMLLVVAIARKERGEKWSFCCLTREREKKKKEKELEMEGNTKRKEIK